MDVTGSSPPSSSHLSTLVNLPVMYLSTNGTAALSPPFTLTLVRICARICDQASSASCCAYALVDCDRSANCGNALRSELRKTNGSGLSCVSLIFL